jgi:MEMO1 family protein
MTPAAGVAHAAVNTVRQPAVAGTFYPADPDRLLALVTWQLAEAEHRYPAGADMGAAMGILVPHAGLEYSGIVAAAGWRAAAGQLVAPPPAIAAPAGAPAPPPPEPASSTVVILGTNHGAAWLDGVAAWDRGAWRTPLGDVAVDEDLAAAIVELGAPFSIDREAHAAEHSIEVQLPFLRVLAPAIRIVPLAVSSGVGQAAVDAGSRLGELLAARWSMGERIVLAISTDMAHYPSHDVAMRVTRDLCGPILALDAVALAAKEAALRRRNLPGLACGMCGIEPAILGLAALRAAGAVRAVELATATSADAGTSPDRTVGYLAAALGS